MLDLNALQSYRKWLDHSPQVVLQSVKHVGGWDVVFPKGLPRWASKVRNFFNVTPVWLKRLDQQTSTVWIGLAKKQNGYILDKVMTDGVSGLKYALAVKNALSGDVYLGNPDPSTPAPIWFQMSPGATIYHYGKTPKWATGEAVWVNERAKLVTFAVGNTDVAGQSLIPVFKLVSPDGTGGSRECIIFSKRLLQPPDSLALQAVASIHHIHQRVTSDWLNLRESVIGGVNVFVGVGDRLETDPVLQGSYNYSETIDRGPDAHELRDVKPHSDARGFYVNPDNQLLPLASRRFRPNDNQGLPLADQVQVD